MDAVKERLEIAEQRAKLLGSLLLFTKVFYKLRTGRDFVVSEPVGRESHQVTISKELKKVFTLETNRLIINVQPGSGKSEELIHFIAWCLAHYPDSNFIYISYSHELAAKHTYTIKQIINLPQYKRLFGVEIKHDSSAKDNFQTSAGGAVKAFGSGGAITGQDAGLPNLDRFSGAVIIDDIHKPDDVHSDTMRESVIKNYFETIMPRPRGVNVPIIFIGQRLHEDDLAANLIAGKDGYDWRKVILKAIDDVGNVLHPAVTPLDMLKRMEEFNPYVYASQYQQNPQPAGGGIFKPEWFVLVDEEPEILATFITGDSAETDKTYNDATAFEFWGLYRIKEMGEEVGLYGLHLIDCLELRVEPKDLENEFNQFYASCMRHKVKPMVAGIEKKSTGVTLTSTLKSKRGLQIIEIERTKASGSKTARYLEIQPYIASKRVSLMSSGHLWEIKDNKPINLFIEHMRKITANNTHKHDDMADACYDAVKLALIDQVISRNYIETNTTADTLITALNNQIKHQRKLRRRAYGYAG